MELERIAIIGVHRDQMTPEPPRHLFADVVVIDRSEDNANFPVIYQLKEDQLHDHELIQLNLSHVSEDMFMLMGEVERVDKPKKIIHLANGDQVTYRYLIIFGGHRSAQLTHSQEEEFRSGLHALFAAMRIKRSVAAPIGAASSPVLSQPHIYRASSMEQVTQMESAPSVTSVLAACLGQQRAASWSQILDHVMAYEVQA